MKNMKRRIIALLTVLTMICSIGTVAMAAESSSLKTTKLMMTEEVEEFASENPAVARATQLHRFSGTISSIKATGSMYLDKNYSDIRFVTAGMRTDGSDASATYKVTFSKGSERRMFVMTLNGVGSMYTVGSMSKGNWTYTIERQRGSGEYAYVIDVYAY